MDISRHLAPLRFRAALVVLVAVATPARAGADGGSCELKIRGHSIANLTLVEKTRSSGVQFNMPGESVQLPAGEYRVEQVELEDGHTLDLLSSLRQDWFEVTPAGPNELVVGAPLYPTATVNRHGGFLQLDYDTVDGAGRSYGKTSGRAPQPPAFTVFKDGQEIGSGSFEYG